VFVADAASVERGAIATRGIDYYQLGVRTAEIAVQILVDGVKPGEIATLQVTDTQVVANTDAARNFGVTIPDAVLDGAEIVTTAAKPAG
jgi:putative ABC transport system substrate-binding protein